MRPTSEAASEALLARSVLAILLRMYKFNCCFLHMRIGIDQIISIARVHIQQYGTQQGHLDLLTDMIWPTRIQLICFQTALANSSLIAFFLLCAQQ